MPDTASKTTKPMNTRTSLIVLSAILALSSCTTSSHVQNHDDDDVYFTSEPKSAKSIQETDDTDVAFGDYNNEYQEEDYWDPDYRTDEYTDQYGNTYISNNYYYDDYYGVGYSDY